MKSLMLTDPEIVAELEARFADKIVQPIHALRYVSVDVQNQLITLMYEERSVSVEEPESAKVQHPRT